MIEVDNSKAKEMLAEKTRDNGYNPGSYENSSVGQLITATIHSIDEDRTVAWCPYCDREKEICICEDEEAKKREREAQMRWNEKEAVMSELKARLSEKEIEKLSKKERTENMEWCPLCHQSRFKDLLYFTQNFSGNETIFGCKHCLKNYKSSE